MDKGYKNLLMVTYIKDTTKMVNLMVKENIFGMMEVHTKEVLSKGFVVVREHGENQTIQVLIRMKVNLLMKKSKDMVYLYGRMEANIWETLLTMLETDMERCIGAMELYIRDNGRMDNKFNRFLNNKI